MRPGKRARLSAEAREPRLEDFPIGSSEVLMHRDDGLHQWDEYCLVVGHSSLGELLVHAPGEPEPVPVSIHSRNAANVRYLDQGAATCGGNSSTFCGGSCSCCTSSSGHCSDVGNRGSGSRPKLDPSVPAPIDDSHGPRPLPVGAALQPREPALQSPEEQFERSALRMSEGRTRDQLNNFLTLLGLTAKFGVPVVSKRNGVPSHLTFNIGDWNDLPQTSAECFEWWLGEGEQRLKDANLINPEFGAQPENGVPLFFAIKRKERGGALCHYGGHFCTQSFRRLRPEEVVDFKGERRQALIELVWHHYDEGLERAVASIPPASAL